MKGTKKDTLESNLKFVQVISYIVITTYLLQYIIMYSLAK